MNIPNLLKDLGLGEAETKIYLEALKRDNFTAREMSDAIPIKRTAVYYTLTILQKKGLVSLCGKGKIEKFKAEQPDQLLALISRQRYKLENMEKKLEGALPFFPEKEISTLGLPNITYHRGMEGMKNLIEKVYQCKERKLYTIMPPFKRIEPYLDEYYSSYYLEERARRSIVTQSIWQDFPSNKIFSNHKKYLRDIRIAPASITGELNSMIDIFDNTVIISTAQPELFGLAIDSYDYSQTMKALFHNLWSDSTPVEKSTKLKYST
ncbi:MAG: helix-turn-helix domain-containing protein [Candidatus Magasanikbacteria bacterium]